DHVRADRVNVRYVFDRDPLSRALVRAPVNFFNAAVKRGGNGVPEMKERIFFEADVNKHRLQPHLDVFDLTLVNAAYDVPCALTLDAVFLEAAALEQSHTGLEFLHTENELVASFS